MHVYLKCPWGLVNIVERASILSSPGRILENELFSFLGPYDRSDQPLFSVNIAHFESKRFIVRSGMVSLEKFQKRTCNFRKDFFLHLRIVWIIQNFFVRWHERTAHPKSRKKKRLQLSQKFIFLPRKKLWRSCLSSSIAERCTCFYIQWPFWKAIVLLKHNSCI